MKVYLVIDHGGYDGEHNASVVGIFFDKEKAKETFDQRVKWAKSDIGEWVEDEDFDGPDEEYKDKFVVDDDYEFEETETTFYAWDVDHCSLNYTNIWIEEREVE